MSGKIKVKMSKIRGDSLLHWAIVLAVVSASFILVRTYLKDVLRHKVEGVSAYLLWKGTNYTPLESEAATKAVSYSSQSQRAQQVERKDKAVTARFYDYSNITTGERAYSVSAEDGAQHELKTVNLSTIIH